VNQTFSYLLPRLPVVSNVLQFVFCFDS